MEKKHEQGFIGGRENVAQARKKMLGQGLVLGRGAIVGGDGR